MNGTNYITSRLLATAVCFLPFLLALSIISARRHPTKRQQERNLVGGNPMSWIWQRLGISKASNTNQSSINWSRGGSSEATTEFPDEGTATLTKEGYDAEEVVRVVWNRHRRWSIAADKQKKKIQFYRACHLFLMIAGTFLQTLATRLSDSKYGWINSLIGGICLSAAPFISNTFLSKETKSDWIHCRSTSEQIKAAVYLFQAGVAPYDSQYPVQTLVNRVADISESSRDLKLFYVMAIGDNKAPPPKLDRPAYIKHRLGTQIDEFYIPTARKLAKKASMLKTCQGILAVGSAAIGLVAGSAGGAMSGVASHAGQTAVSGIIEHVGMWGASLATAAAAFGTHIASTRYDDDVMEWSTTAQRLENLYLRLPKTVLPGSQEWTDFVLSCEEIIASNTRNWANVVASSDVPSKRS